jgi:hypothetical protein
MSEAISGIWTMIPLGIRIAGGLIGMGGTVWAIAHTLGIHRGRVSEQISQVTSDVDHLHNKVRTIEENQKLYSRELSVAIRGQAEEIKAMQYSLERHDGSFRDLRAEIIDLVKWLKNGGTKHVQ